MHGNLPRVKNPPKNNRSQSESNFVALWEPLCPLPKKNEERKKPLNCQKKKKKKKKKCSRIVDDKKALDTEQKRSVALCISSTDRGIFARSCREIFADLLPDVRPIPFSCSRRFASNEGELYTRKRGSFSQKPRARNYDKSRSHDSRDAIFFFSGYSLLLENERVASEIHHFMLCRTILA